MLKGQAGQAECAGYVANHAHCLMHLACARRMSTCWLIPLPQGTGCNHSAAHIPQGSPTNRHTARAHTSHGQAAPCIDI